MGAFSIWLSLCVHVFLCRRFSAPENRAAAPQICLATLSFDLRHRCFILAVKFFICLSFVSPCPFVARFCPQNVAWRQCSSCPLRDGTRCGETHRAERISTARVFILSAAKKFLSLKNRRKVNAPARIHTKDKRLQLKQKAR